MVDKLNQDSTNTTKANSTDEDAKKQVVVEAEKKSNIEQFRQSIVEHGVGVVPKHSFLVMFAGLGTGASEVLGNYNDWFRENMMFRCESAQLPGVTALKEEIRRFGYGPIEEVPYGMQFQDMTLGFIVSRNSFQFKFFNEWMNYITNFRSYGGSNMLLKDLKSGISPYEVSYKDDYTMAQSNIFVYDRSNIQTMVYEIYDMFPIAINTTDVSWGDADQLMRMYVRFAYTDYTIKTPQLPIVPTKNELDLKAAQEAQARKDKKKKTTSSGSSVADVGGATHYNAQGSINSSTPTKLVVGPEAVISQSASLNTYPATNNGYVPVNRQLKPV